MPPIRPPPPSCPEMSQDRSLKRALDSVESLDELADGSLASSQKYFEVDSSKVYLKITDIVKDLNQVLWCPMVFSSFELLAMSENLSKIE